MLECARERGVVDNEVTIAAYGQCTLLRKHVELLCRVRAACIDQRSQVDFSCSDPIGMDQIDPLLDGRDPVRDPRECLKAHLFLAPKS